MRPLAALCLLVGTAFGCGDGGGAGGPTPDPAATPCAVVTTGMGLRWEKLNHRVSWMRLAPVQEGCQVPSNLDVAFIGGDFTTGDVMMDVPELFYAATGLSGAGSVGAHAGSVTFTLTAPDEEATGLVDVDLVLARLTGFTTYVVLVTGFEIRTDVPQTDAYPDNGYDPAHGYTTRGHGVGVSEPVVSGDDLTFTARLRVAWGPSDREDMNEALAYATAEGVVHYLVLGITGGAVSSVENGYRLAYDPPVPLIEQVIAPPATEDIRVDVPVDPALPVLVPGWRSFDLRLDPDGTAASDAGGPVGYYLRGWSVDAKVVDHRSDEATLEISGYASNASGFIAYYPLVMDFQGMVTLIQLPEAVTATQVELFESFDTGTESFPIR